MAAVDWQTTCTNIKQRCVLLLQTEEWSDCDFLIGPEEARFRAHKIILTMASPVFESMFIIDKQEDTFKIPDLEPDTFKALVDYIYTENISIDSFPVACKLYVAANKYLVQQLARVCAEFMASAVAPENVCDALEVGMQFQDKQLINDCKQVIGENIREILNSDGFMKLDIATISQIFSMEGLRVEEIELFNALERYALTHSCRKRADMDQSGEGIKSNRNIHKALEQIRFLTFSLHEFAQNPAQSGLLTRSEALAIMINIVGGKAPMPDKFSTNRQVRFKRPAPLPPPPVVSNNTGRGVVRVSMLCNDRVSCVSDRTAVGGRQWTLHALPHITFDTANITDKNMTLYLSCEETESAPWACVADIEFVLLPSRTEPNQTPHVVKKNHVFTSSSTKCWAENCLRPKYSESALRKDLCTFEARISFEITQRHQQPSTSAT